MADNFNVKDSDGIARILRFIDVASVFLPAHVLIDSAGNELKGSKTSALSIPVVLPTDMALLGRGLETVSHTFTRPANVTAYASGDLVANSTTAGSVVIPVFTNIIRISAGAGILHGALIRKSTTSLTNALFRVHIFNAIPVTSAGDNAAMNNTGAGATPSWIGAIDVTVDQAFNDGSIGVGVPNTYGNAGIALDLASGRTLYALIEARAAYTPGNAEVFVISLTATST